MTADLSAVAAIVAHARWDILILLGLLSGILSFFYESWVLGRALSMLGIRLNFRRTMLIKGGAHLPGLVNASMGSLFVAYRLRQELHVPFMTGVGTALLVDVADLFSLAAVVLFCGLLMEPVTGSSAHPAVLITAAVIAAGILTSILYWRVEDKVPGLRRLTRLKVFTPFKRLSTGGHFMLIFLKLPRLLAELLIDYMILRLFGIDIPLLAFATLYPVVVFSAVLPVSINGIGSTQVAARVLLLNLVISSGLHSADALARIDAYSMSLVLMSILIKVGIGVVSILLTGGGPPVMAGTEEAGQMPTAPSSTEETGEKLQEEVAEPELRRR